MIAGQLISKAQHLVPASHTAIKLIGMLDKPTIANEEIVQALKYDTVLTAKLLRACNSSFYGFSEPIASVEQAVLMLGYQQIFHLVFSIAFQNSMAKPLPGYAVENDEFWQHSLVTALVCEKLAKDVSHETVEPTLAFTAGLLHDIGKLVMNEALTPEHQTNIRSRIKENGHSRPEAEQEIIGTDHAEVGARLLQRWQLPESIIEGISNHHHPIVRPRMQLSTFVHMADCLAHHLNYAFGWEAFAVPVVDGVTQSLGLTAEKIETLLINMRDGLVQAKCFETLA